MVNDLLQLKYPVLRDKVVSKDSGSICEEGVGILTSSYSSIPEPCDPAI